MLQKYDAAREEARCKFDLQRDEAQRKFIAAMLGVKLRDDRSKQPEQPPVNQQKRTMTSRDIMRTYSK